MPRRVAAQEDTCGTEVYAQRYGRDDSLLQAEVLGRDIECMKFERQTKIDIIGIEWGAVTWFVTTHVTTPEKEKEIATPEQLLQSPLTDKHVRRRSWS